MWKPSCRWLLAVVAGCAAPTSYVYSPQDVCHWVDGYPADSQLVPPEAPQGTIEVSSFGFVEIEPDGQGSLAVLHVRLAITNDGDASPWKITPGEQLIDISGGEHIQPMSMKPELPMNEAVPIGQHERKPLDLYFALPAHVDSEDTLMAFDLMWQVTTPVRTYASRTHFERHLSSDPRLWSCTDRP